MLHHLLNANAGYLTAPGTTTKDEPLSCVCVSVYICYWILCIRADVRRLRMACMEQLICRGFYKNTLQRHKFKWIQEAMVWKENNNLLSVLKL